MTKNTKKKYKVDGVIIDVNDRPRRFELEVHATSPKTIEREVKKAYHLTRHDLVRDVSYIEIN